MGGARLGISRATGRFRARRAAALAVAAALLAALIGAVTPPRAMALPLYARQTGQVCAACHTGFFELTPAGRRFKLGGYTLSGGKWSGPPFAVMLQPTFTHTEAGQPGGAAPGFGRNDNFAMQEISLFTGGRFTDDFGAFIQGTYDGVSHRFGWDNTDIRYARSLKLGSHDLLLGLSLNNNPSVQDVWNTTPAWRFPFISSTLAPQPAAGTFIEGAFAQRVVGVSAYGFLDDMLYLEAGAYRPLSPNTELALGVDTTGESPISGAAAPYWRLAAEKDWGNHSLELGAFGLAADVRPLRMSGAGSDAFTDIGADVQYQFIGDPHAVTFRAAWIHENHDLSASKALGLADNSRDVLRSFNASVSYIYDRTWSFTLGRMMVSGTSDATLYGTPGGSPDSSAWTGEIAYLPFMHGGPSFWPWLNARIGVQYTRWDRFDGSASNIDGMGRQAHANNTVFAYAWIAF